jgi:hypothetical protein
MCRRAKAARESLASIFRRALFISQRLAFQNSRLLDHARVLHELAKRQAQVFRNLPAHASRIPHSGELSNQQIRNVAQTGFEVF